MLGKELAFDETLSKFEQLYIKLFGIPINGLRNRARRVLPLVFDKYKKILDSGCGQGVITFEIARRLPESTITGTDSNKLLVERNNHIAEIIGLKNCNFEYHDITEMPLYRQYDLVLSIDSLEHIEDDNKVLRNYYNALKHGGDMIIHVPAYNRRWFFFRLKINFEVEGHVRPGYTIEAIIKKVENAGFIILDNYYTYGWLETIANNISYLITGARMKNKFLYAFAFPILLLISWAGRNSKPVQGGGILIKAGKRE